MPTEEPTPEPTVELTPAPTEEPTPEPTTESASEIVLAPLWNLYIPDSLEISFGAESVTLSPAVVEDVENLGKHRICLTITSTCVFLGNEGEVPVTLFVDGQHIAPGEAVVYGVISEEGAVYKPITLLFSENAWNGIAAGSYSLAISYNSYVE